MAEKGHGIYWAQVSEKLDVKVKMTKPMDEIRDRVAAVVVTYNRAEMLRQCLMSLQKQTMPCDILVVDNASTEALS